jgi:hypothetical protein
VDKDSDKAMFSFNGDRCNMKADITGHGLISTEQKSSSHGTINGSVKAGNM